MPIQVYSIQTRGHNMGGSQRVNSKQEADDIYTSLLDAINSDKPICEIELNGNKVCFRTKDLTGFGITVHLEETPEEIKARQIQAIESGYGLNHGYPQADCSPKMAGGSLIGY
jgi:hypothetical protein